MYAIGCVNSHNSHAQPRASPCAPISSPVSRVLTLNPRMRSISLASCLLGPICLEGKSSTCGSNLSSFEESADAENSDLDFCCCCSVDLGHVLAKEAVALRRNTVVAARRDMARLYCTFSSVVCWPQITIAFAAPYLE